VTREGGHRDCAGKAGNRSIGSIRQAVSSGLNRSVNAVVSPKSGLTTVTAVTHTLDGEWFWICRLERKRSLSESASGGSRPRPTTPRCERRG
jgi:hypothetical protein